MSKTDETIAKKPKPKNKNKIDVYKYMRENDKK
jgi:hypothetical protein